MAHELGEIRQSLAVRKQEAFQKSRLLKEPQVSTSQSTNTDTPQWKVTLWMLQRDRWAHPALCNPEGRSLLRIPAQTSNTKTTPKTVDWSQPEEVYYSLPSPGNPSKALETADWSQLEDSDLRCSPALDPKVEEFLSGDKPKDDPTMWEHLPEPSFTNSKDWVAWQAEQVAMPS